jgi:hypothetical protein
MKNLIFTAAIGLTLLPSPSLAQDHPLRFTFGATKTSGGSSSLVGVSVDIKALSPKRTLSLYTDSSYTTGDTKPEYGGVQSFGVSLRQPSKNSSGWVGLGVGFYDVGSYDTPFRDREFQRHIRGVGGKVFIGTGRGISFTEAALTLPAATKYLQASLTIGVRL